MIEISTIPIERPLLSRIIANARLGAGFVLPQKQMTALTLDRPFPPRIGAFHVDGMMPLSLDGCGSLSLSCFLSVLSRLRGSASSCMLKLEISQSGREFDVREESDLSFGIGFDWFGPCLYLEFGGVSDACTDLRLRMEIFQDLLGLSGIGDQSDLRIENGELTFESNLLSNVGGMARSQAIALVGGGARVYRTNYGNVRGNNFRHLSVYPSCDSFRSVAETCYSHFCSLGKLMSSSVALTIDRDAYEGVRSIVAQDLKLDSWSLLLMAKQKYDLDSVDLALSETQSLLMPLLEIELAGTGTVFVDLYHDNGTISLLFCNEGEDPVASTAAIRDLIGELADGEAIIDETVG
jgi:hypothetical protein